MGPDQHSTRSADEGLGRVFDEIDRNIRGKAKSELQLRRQVAKGSGNNNDL